MKLTLKIDGKKKQFSMPAGMPAVRFKQAIRLAMEFEKNFSVELLDQIENFIANDLYGGKFTAEEYSMGMEVDNYLEITMQILMSPVNRAKGQFEELKN
ncbi:Uncharacterized protein B5E38_4990 [Bacillus cereus]|nr:Uncharacterized protein B5E38_4990 [Bacillus cereus]ARO65077.1 Uncharacterized protein B5E39_2706 [Bacillus cereus]